MTRTDMRMTDVGEAYAAMHGATRDELLEIRKYGVSIGHSGVTERACELLGEGLSEAETMEALRNAVGARGWTVNDRRTAVGEFYQGLFRRDFDGVGIIIRLEDGRSGRFAYTQLEGNERFADELNMANHVMLKSHGIENSMPVPRNEDFQPKEFNVYPFGVPKLVDWEPGYISAEFPFGTMAAYVSGNDMNGKPVINVDYFCVDGEFERIVLNEKGIVDAFRGHYDSNDPEGLTYLRVPANSGISNSDVAGHLVSLLKPDLAYFDRSPQPQVQ